MNRLRTLVSVPLVALALSLSSAVPTVSAQAKAHVATVATAQQLDASLLDRRYPELRDQLPSAQLSPVERDYFEGMLANRENRLPESIRLLDKALPTLRSQSPQRAAYALHALADSCVKSFRYADAVRAYRDLLTNFASYLDKAERKSTDDDYRTFLLLKDAQPQSIEFKESFTLPTHPNKLGTINAEVTLGSDTRPWLLDTGANQSVITESLAKKIGLPLSRDVATTQGITGAENALHTVVVPEMHIGSAVVRNMVLLVVKDKSLNVPIGSGSVQIEAILGYPVLSAFGSITFEPTQVRFGGETRSSSGAPMFMELLSPQVQCHVGGRDVVFAFDTGAHRSVFNLRYYKHFGGALNDAIRHPYGISGAGGMRRVDAYYQRAVELGIGDKVAKLTNVPVIPLPMGSDLDKTYGNLGLNVVANFTSFTLDFANMRFVLGDPVPVDKKR